MLFFAAAISAGNANRQEYDDRLWCGTAGATDICSADAADMFTYAQGDAEDIVRRLLYTRGLQIG